ncbi:conserved hypothetical protein [Ricinus communis]|uniref:Uncharacterized protein n=1 Tax=Ricinus communis TaxID=3988 RepID=B9T6H2_RICCO|nr:conserved hypothetical protein [Ricinus communis]
MVMKRDGSIKLLGGDILTASLDLYGYVYWNEHYKTIPSQFSFRKIYYIYIRWSSLIGSHFIEIEQDFELRFAAVQSLYLKICAHYGLGSMRKCPSYTGEMPLAGIPAKTSHHILDSFYQYDTYTLELSPVSTVLTMRGESSSHVKHDKGTDGVKYVNMNWIWRCILDLVLLLDDYSQIYWQQDLHSCLLTRAEIDQAFDRCRAVGHGLCIRTRVE